MEKIESLALDTVAFEMGDGSLAVYEPIQATGIMEKELALVEAPRHSMPSISSGRVEDTRIRRAPWERACKKGIDYCGSFILLAIASPLLLAIAIAIKLGDGQNVLYRRRVVGQEGTFDAFKFRTMRSDADAVLERMGALKAEFEKNFKLVNDPRVTRVGAFLRKYSLDELPQLLNVLAGQMSLVGPRMITVPELEKYGKHQELLITVKPGITGFWQVNGRQRVSYGERVAMDIHYILNWNLGLDLMILMQTPLKILKADGAY